MTAADAASTAPRTATRTPALIRRMACFVYEAMLMFGLGLVAGALGALFTYLSGKQHPLQSETVIRLFALLVYAIYFIACWSARGQTLAMQTWRIRLETIHGAQLSQPRAALRFIACCAVWFAPAALLTPLASLAPWPSLGAFAAWIVIYALLSQLEPNGQFWHDRWCGTRLVDLRG